MAIAASHLAVSRRFLRALTGTTMLIGTGIAGQAAAQTRVVSACSGVQLPRSVVTGIVSPVLTGITAPIENRVNAILNAPLLGLLLPPLDTDITGLLDTAASGAPITLQVLDTSGNVVGPADQCRATSDAISLNTPAGISIGGNRIAGLGAEGAFASAADIDAIAFGNGAVAAGGATGSIAFGADSSVTVANSVALGAGTVAERGALAGYAALGLAAPQTSAGEVSVGGGGGLRQITNVAAGSAATDAATVGQLSGIADQVGTLAGVVVRYDDATRARATLAGAGGTVLANVGAGALDAASTEAVNGSQLFATNTQVAANTAAIARIDSGSAGPVRYSTPDAPTVPNGGAVTNDLTLAGTGGGVRLHNVAAGVVGAGSTDAVNGDQLNTTNQNVTAIDARVTANEGRLTTIDARVTNNDARLTTIEGSVGAIDSRVTNNTTQIANNTTAITQLQNNVTGTGTAVTNLTVQVDANTTAITNLQTQVGNQPLRYADAGSPTTPNGGTLTDDATLVGASGGPVGLHNVRAGVVAAGSTDAVNGGQLAETNAQVAANTTAIANLSVAVGGSALAAIQYSNPGSPTTPNGGVRTNDVTLVGANAAAPVGLHNVAGGSVTAGSTDAVNGGQLFAVAQQASNSLQYDRDAGGARTNRITLAGGNAAAPVVIANVAAGAVAAGSTQAVNGGQLHATDQTAQAALALGANSVQYDAGGNVTLGNGTTAVAVRNVAAGTAPTDAVNVAQLQASMRTSFAETVNYVDTRLAQVGFDLRDMRRDMSAGSSAAMAVAALPQAMEPGATMVAVGAGTYRGQSAIAFGASRAFNDGRAVAKFGGTYDSRGYVGANAGVGFQF